MARVLTDCGTWELSRDLNNEAIQANAADIITLTASDAAKVPITLKTVTALVDTAATLTAAQMVGGIFTAVPTTARIQTTDTAANIIAAVGSTVGTWFDFSIVVTAAFNETLAGGTDVTIVGDVVVNDSSGTFRAVVTSGTEVSIYRI